MNFNSLEEIPKKESYSAELEKMLGVGDVVDQLENEFDIFLQERNKFNPSNELDMLRTIKLFIYKEREKVQAITLGSILSEFDCLTLSIIACLIAHRKGYDTKIGRPDKISRYFHSLIIKKDGEMFKIAGRNRNYGVKEMSTDDVITRLKKIGPAINAVNKIKDHLKINKTTSKK